MNYTADCPSCRHEFEIEGEVHARAGLVCPKCAHSFTPETIHKVSEDATAQRFAAMDRRIAENRETARQSEINRLEAVAGWFSFGAGSCVALAILLVLIGLFTQLDSGDKSPLFPWAAECVALAVPLFFFAQVFHIRAALERLKSK